MSDALESGDTDRNSREHADGLLDGEATLGRVIWQSRLLRQPFHSAADLGAWMQPCRCSTREARGEDATAAQEGRSKQLN